MKIGIVGGGPAGLYFALLMKRQDPGHEIQVVEQNPAGATYGWGVVFSDRALSFLAEADPESYRDLEPLLQTWSDQAIVHRGQRVRIDGLGFSGIARIELLRVLQQHCRQRGVALHFDTRLTDLARLDGCDLVVGADGVGSLVREVHRASFQPSIEELSNRYIWYGTDQPFDCLTLTFRENGDGAFVAHHYRYGESASTFIVECDAETWAAAGLAAMPEADSLRYCEELFREELGGHPLLTNRSLWLRFKVVTNRRWVHDNVVLLGDALRTVHFSIGSGTRMALEDAIALARAFAAQGEVRAALRAFEDARRPAVERFLEVAAQSFTWYERFREAMPLDALPFAHAYVMRSGRISPARLRARSPGFAAAYEAYLAASASPPVPPPPRGRADPARTDAGGGGRVRRRTTRA
jgi:2-polyprenyl-6-methoxyphenol hydroxylase-like FAD-dependent oxidoreductase